MNSPTQRTPSLWEVAGSAHSALRDARGWSQDYVAFRMRTIGIPAWTRAVVAAYEAGTRQITVEELLALAIVHGVPAARLLEAPALRFGTRELTGDSIQRLLSEGPGQEIADAFELDDFGRPCASPTPSQLTAVAGLELEKRIAKRFGVEPEAVALMAFRIFHRPATDERNRRVRARRSAGRSERAMRISEGRAVAEELATESGWMPSRRKSRQGAGRRH